MQHLFDYLFPRTFSHLLPGQKWNGRVIKIICFSWIPVLCSGNIRINNDHPVGVISMASFYRFLGKAFPKNTSSQSHADCLVFRQQTSCQWFYFVKWVNTWHYKVHSCCLLFVFSVWWMKGNYRLNIVITGHLRESEECMLLQGIKDKHKLSYNRGL